MKLDEVLAQACRLSFADYHPRRVIDAVNALVPLGKEDALAALNSQLARQGPDAGAEEGLFLVLRVLFVVPVDPGHQPPMRLGGTAPPPPSEPARLPHFPLVLIDDVPLLMIAGYALGGDTEPVSVHLAHYAAHGTIRESPLRPTHDADWALARFTATYTVAYDRAPSSDELARIQAQLRDVYT
jgi:hypothetical protein